MDNHEKLIPFPEGSAAPPVEPGQAPKVLLLGLDTAAFNAQRSMEELAALAEAGGFEVVGEVLQRRAAPVAATVLGAGRLAEARLLAHNLDVHSAVFDGELSGSQIRNIEEALAIPVIDRTMLILSIFASRATTAEGKVQTELATLEYRLPRLAGLGASLSRQGGGGAGGAGARRGGGETQLEYDRRYVRKRIALLKKRLAGMEQHRQEARRSRDKSGVPVVALVGYTNVGKSSLLNALAGSHIHTADALFATLDATARRANLPDGHAVVLVDTVGFVSRLPHHLVQAFHSTLEEAVRADVLLKVCDATDPAAEEQLAVTDEVLASLGAGNLPQLVVYNKCDLMPGFIPPLPGAVAVSAATGQGLDVLQTGLAALLAESMRRLQLLIPYDKMQLVDALRRHGSVLRQHFREDGVYLEALIDRRQTDAFLPYLYVEK